MILIVSQNTALTAPERSMNSIPAGGIASGAVSHLLVQSHLLCSCDVLCSQVRCSAHIFCSSVFFTPGAPCAGQTQLPGTSVGCMSQVHPFAIKYSMAIPWGLICQQLAWALCTLLDSHRSWVWARAAQCCSVRVPEPSPIPSCCIPVHPQQGPCRDTQHLCPPSWALVEPGPLCSLCPSSCQLLQQVCG